MLKTCGVLAMALAFAGCAGKVASKSTGSNWLGCTSNADCAGLPAAHCEERVCVDEQGVPIDATEPMRTDVGVGGSGGDGGARAVRTGVGGANDTIPRGAAAFARCATPPQSECTVAETCAGLDCGGPQYDGNGCQRTVCTEDDACAADERCTLLACRDTNVCSYYTSGVCTCGGPAVCRVASYCNPTFEVGPRGAWTSLAFRTTYSLCGDNGDMLCTDVLRVTADGLVSGRATTSDGVNIHDAGLESRPLGDSDKQTLGALIDGPAFRSAVEKGLPCSMTTAEDVYVSVTLTLATQTLERDVTGCIEGGDPNNFVNQVYTLLGQP